MKITEGFPQSDVVLVGQSLGNEEIKYGKPWVGYAGHELTRMLGEAGLNRQRMYLTNVLHEMAPWNQFMTKTEAKKHGITEVDGRYPHPRVLAGRNALRAELEQLSPNVIIAAGDTALWAITGISDGIKKWRGSTIDSVYGKVIATYNPADVIRQWDHRWIIVQDFRRVFREMAFPEVRKPDWKFLVRPTFSEAIEALEWIRGKQSAWDIESRGGQIACVGFAPDKLNAVCIPFMCIENEGNYWSFEEEMKILLKMREVMLETPAIYQNAHYDSQMFAKQFGFIPKVVHDTLVMMHVCFPGLQKSLDFIASLMCEYYCYWKDDGKTWDKYTGEEQLWTYNCEDCVRTVECFEELDTALDQMGLRGPYERQMRLFKPVLKMMLQGVRIDRKRKLALSGELLVARQSRMEWLESILGYELNPRSHKQMMELFYDELNMKVIKDRKTKRPTINDDALEIMKVRQPLLAPLIQTIQEIRSLGVFKSTFADAEIDYDDRVRCSFNTAGPETFRFSSSKNIFGTGLNLQTIPKGTEDK